MNSTPQRPRNLDWRPYLFLLLLPLMFLGLDSFSLSIKPIESNQATGIWPRFIDPSTQILHLSLPAGGLQPSGLQITGSNGEMRLPATIKASDWQVQVPRLAPGQYQMQLLAGDQPYGPHYPLSVRPAVAWQIRQNQSSYSPGEWLIVSLYLNATARHLPKLKAEIIAPNGQMLFESVIPSEAGLWPLKTRLPLDIQTGSVQVKLVSDSNVIAQQKINIQKSPEPAQSMQIIAFPQEVLAGQKQDLEFQVLDPKGQLADEAWIRVFGQTLQVKQGRASLKDQSVSSRVPFTAGDSKGNLLQSELSFELLNRPWLAQYHPQQKIQIQARQAIHATWLLGSGQNIKTQGQQDLNKGSQGLNLPDLKSAGPYWLYICDSFGLCQEVHWQQEAQSVKWKLQPPQPHALESMRFSPALEFSQSNGLLESFRKHIVGFEIQSAPFTNPQTWLQPVGFPAPAQTPIGILFACLLLGILILLSPLYWLWQQSKLYAKSRPFPHPINRKRIILAQVTSLGLSTVALLAMCLTWFQQWQGAGLLASLGSLSAGTILIYWLRNALKHLHPMAMAVPFLQACLISVLIWFVLTYQPGVLGAVCLLLSLLALSWTQLWQEQINIRRLENWHILNLASLVVMLSLHLVLVLGNRLAWPIPHWQQASHLLQSHPQQLVMRSQLLSYQNVSGISDQVMPASNRAGKQALQWRIWQASGAEQTFIHDLQQEISIKPVVLALANLPSYAYIGDEIRVPLQLSNETGRTQATRWQLGDHSEHDLELKARSSQQAFEILNVTRSGWNLLQLSHQFEDTWYHQNLRFYGIAPDSPKSVPDLQLDLRLPAHQGLVPDEEIPVLVRFKHRSASPQMLGLQIHLPAASVALTDTLSERRHQKWLSHLKQTEESLQIQTRMLEPGQEISFHFRLRVTMPGKYQMPSPSLFYLDQPQRATVLNIAERLEINAN